MTQDHITGWCFQCEKVTRQDCNPDHCEECYEEFPVWVPGTEDSWDAWQELKELGIFQPNS